MPPGALPIRRRQHMSGTLLAPQPLAMSVFRFYCFSMVCFQESGPLEHHLLVREQRALGQGGVRSAGNPAGGDDLRAGARLRAGAWEVRQPPAVPSLVSAVRLSGSSTICQVVWSFGTTMACGMASRMRG